jgi:hypothetical protein
MLSTALLLEPNSLLFLFCFVFFFPIVACMETKVLIICRMKYKILSFYIWWTIRLKKSYFWRYRNSKNVIILDGH